MKIPKHLIIVLVLISSVVSTAANVSRDAVAGLAQKGDVDAIRQMGPGVLPVLASLYESYAEEQRATIAGIFYQLGWQSVDAKRVLMKDIHSQNSSLRIQVQYALGRVSNGPDVVDALLSNMQDDANPLFRDKAACSLAYDQIHLTEQQKARLFAGVIHALRDPKLQVRQIAIRVLQIHTGQTKRYNPGASEAERETRVKEWEKWLEEYKSNL